MGICGPLLLRPSRKYDKEVAKRSEMEWIRFWVFGFGRVWLHRV